MQRSAAAIALGFVVLVGAAKSARAGGDDATTAPSGNDALAAPSADAREASRAAYRRGVAEFGSGNYPAARDAFIEAYRLFPHPSILYNLGLARLRTHDYLEAEKDFLKFLEDDGGAEPEDLWNARNALTEARQHVGTFLLRVSPNGARAELDDAAVALIPGHFVEVRTTVGPHALHVEAEGYDARDQNVDVAARTSSRIDIGLQRRGDADGDNASGGDAHHARKTEGFVLVGVGAGLAVVSLVTALRAKSLADDYNTPNSGEFQDPGARSTGITFRTLADVAGVSALLAAGVGVYLLLTPAPQSAAKTSVVLLPGYGGLTGRF